jgi:hypothetical protein
MEKPVVKRTRAKYTRAKCAFPTKMSKGNGNNRGMLIVGHIPALRDIETTLGRPLRNPRLVKNRFLWVFKEA